jgi:hypothetical protein
MAFIVRSKLIWWANSFDRYILEVADGEAIEKNADAVAPEVLQENLDTILPLTDVLDR